MTGGPTLFDEAEGRRRRDDGMQLVEDHNERWCDRFYRFVGGLVSGWEGPSESLRAFWHAAGGSSPKHSNAWGAAVRGAIRKGLLIPTGRYIGAKNVDAHARKVQVLRRP